MRAQRVLPLVTGVILLLYVAHNLSHNLSWKRGGSHHSTTTGEQGASLRKSADDLKSEPLAEVAGRRNERERLRSGGSTAKPRDSVRSEALPTEAVQTLRPTPRLTARPSPPPPSTSPPSPPLPTPAPTPPPTPAPLPAPTAPPQAQPVRIPESLSCPVESERRFVWTSSWETMRWTQKPKLLSASIVDFPANSITPQKPILDERVASAIAKNKREAYRRVISELRNDGSAWLTALACTSHEVSQSRVLIFRDVLVNREGWIADTKTGAKVRNGACPTGAAFSAPGAPPSHERVITLAASWTEFFWHFTMEAVVGLAALDDNSVSSSGALIHVKDPNAFVLDWLALLGFPRDRVVTGSVWAKELVVPEMGKCGTPTPHQLQWYGAKIAQVLGGEVRQRKKIVLIKRTQSRPVRNHDAVEAAVRAFASARGLELYLHDDSVKMPDLRTQLTNFAEAAAVVGPHGAAFANLIAAAPGTLVVEFMDPSYINICYTRVSTLLGHDYRSVPILGGRADLAALKAEFERAPRI